MSSSVGQMLRLWRREAGLTQEALAAKARLSVEAISALERGIRRFPHPGTVDGLARALSLTEEQRQDLAAASSRRGRPQPAAPASRAPGAVIPREVPLDVDGFSGRKTELAELGRLLDASTYASSASLVCALTGTGGIGKSALAIHWAHQVTTRFPDGQLWIDLRGFDTEQPVPATAALARVLAALGVSRSEVPADLDEQEALYRSLLAERSMLVVIDNARDSEHCRPLLPGASSCLTIVTSRDSLTGLVVRHGAHRIDVDALPLSDATLLLTKLIGRRAADDPDAVSEIAVRCARIPLALRIAANLASTPGSSIDQLADDLAVLHQRLDLLDAGAEPRTALRAVFSWSYRHLRPDLQTTFRMIGLHPGPDIDQYGVAALADADATHAGELLEELRRGHLIHETGPKRYGMHDLLRAWAIEQGQAHDAKVVRQAAITRLFDYYRHAALTAMKQYSPAERDRLPPVRRSATSPPFTDHAVAASWLEAERPNLVAIAVYAAEHGSPEYTRNLSRILFQYLVVSAHDHDAELLHTIAVDVSEGSERTQAMIRLGDAYRNMGRLGEALQILERCLSRSRRLGDRRTEGPALLNLGIVYSRLGRYADALECYQDSRSIAQEVGNRQAEGSAFNNLGSVCILLGRYDDAIAHLQQASAIARELGDRSKESFALGNLGECYEHLGRYHEALDHYRRSMEMTRELHHRGRGGYALHRIGVVYARLGRYDEAIAHQREALAIARSVGRPKDEIEALNEMGRTLRRAGRAETAIDCHREVLRITEGSGYRFDSGRAHDGLGSAYRDLADTDRAVDHWLAAFEILSQLGVPEAHEVRAQLVAVGATPDGDRRPRTAADPRFA